MTSRGLLYVSLMGVACSIVVATERSHAADVGQKKVAVLLSPADGDRIPRADKDVHCAKEPCTKIFVTGRVAPGQTPFLAVAPLGGSVQRIWVQPPILATKPDGTFDGLVYLGTEREGVGEKFSIFVFGCQQKDRFREAEHLRELPTDCAVSSPTTVLRVR